MSSYVQIGIADSVVAGGTVTTPAAAAAVASTSVLPKGVYEVEVSVTLSGTAETKTANASLAHNTGNTTVVYSGLLTLAQPIRLRIRRVTVDGTVGLSVTASTLATTGAVYNATISATRVE